MMCALARRIPEADRSTPHRQLGARPLHGRRAPRQDPRHRRLRDDRRHRGDARAGASGCTSSPTTPTSRRTGPPRSASRWRRWTSLLRDSDVITLHVPLTDGTRGMIDADALARTKEGVRIVNCARGRTDRGGRPQARHRERPRRRRRARRVRGGAGPRQPAVCAGPGDRDAPSRRLHGGGAGERGAADRRSRWPRSCRAAWW